MRVWSSASLLCASLACLCACTASDAASPPFGAGAPTRPAEEVRETSPEVPASAIHHVLSTGQSLAVGVGGAPALSLSQPYAHRMFNGGVIPGGAGGPGLTAFVPLVEASVETMSSSFANLVTQLASGVRARHDLLVSVHGVSGAPYRALKKGSSAYAIGMEQVKAGVAIASARGITYDVTAVTTAHGAADHIEKNARYAEDLVAWQRDYESDVRALTGQTRAVPLFQTQYSSFSVYDPTSAIPGAQLRAHVENPGRIVLVGPRYPLRYAADGVHLTNEGYRMLGAMHAKAYRRVVVEGGAWEPLRPILVTRTSAVITVKLTVPVPPIVLDTVLASDPGHMGFAYVDDGPATPTITSVSIASADSVTITLSAEPTGDNKRLRYAHTGAQGAGAGLQSGPRGNLRDSDAVPLLSGSEPFYNWCVHFDEPVP